MAIAKYLRYPDLVEAGVVANRVTLHRMIKSQGFPPGRLLGLNTREQRFKSAASKSKAGTVKTKRQRRVRR
jgi:hypothetical protein